MKSSPAPVKVSPTIKFARWSLLFTGMFYGWTKRGALERLEVKAAVLRRQALERRDLIDKENKKRTYIELLTFLGGLCGMKFPPNWEPPV